MAAEIGWLRAAHAMGWKLDFAWSVLLDQESSPISVRLDPARGRFRYFLRVRPGLETFAVSAQQSDMRGEARDYPGRSPTSLTLDSPHLQHT
jgi:hypothetical protein